MELRIDCLDFDVVWSGFSRLGDSDEMGQIIDRVAYGVEAFVSGTNVC